MDYSILRNLSYGLYVCASLDGQRPVGCIINTAVQVTASPQTVAVSLNKQNHTLRCILESGRFSLSILSQAVDKDVFATFGFASSRDTDKFSGFPCRMEDGLPLLAEGTCGGLICRVLQTLDCGTHMLVQGELQHTAPGDAGSLPMTYAYYHTVVKGGVPSTAPSYVQREERGRVRCRVCGYVMEGTANDLQPGFSCPVCAALPEEFEELPPAF